MTLPERLPAWPSADQWTRLAWASERAKALWQPRLSQVTAALGKIELESALCGFRPSAMLFKTAEELPAITAKAIAFGCSALVLGIEGASPALYAASSAPFRPGQPFKFRVVITRDVEQWKSYAAGDELAIGRALGYPVCCSEFYRETWVEGGWRDTTLPMFERSRTMGTRYGNILLRWAGVRLMRHLPCAFDCSLTDWIGRQTEEIGRSLGLRDEMDWAIEMLDWPIEWTSLHGIAEIKTPVLKISTSTDPLARKAIVRREGASYPAEGATGLVFPFRQPEKRAVTESRSFARATQRDDWEGNGFASRETMNAAHEIVADVARAAIAGVKPTSVLDLGCGNAALLERICDLSSEWLPVGIERDRPRILLAVARLGHGHFTLGDIFDTSLWAEHYGLVLLMPGRLAEVEALRGPPTEFLAHLRTHAEKVVVYTYGDWMADGGLRALCDRFGLKIAEHSLALGRHAEAALLQGEP